MVKLKQLVRQNRVTESAVPDYVGILNNQANCATYSEDILNDREDK